MRGGREKEERVNIGIIGSGNIGGTAGRLWARAGHDVLFSYSRDPQKLEDLAASVGEGARAGTPEEAARFGGEGVVVVLSVPWGRVEDAVSAAGGAAAFEGKTVVDTTNPLGEGGPALDGATGAEAVARLLPGAKVVKAYNTLESGALASGGGRGQGGGEPLALFLSGDDEAAKGTVAGLISDSGFGPVDLGALPNARAQEPGGPLFNRPMGAEEGHEAAARLRA